MTLIDIFRGEKLYVTKDSRVKSKKNRMCWIICLGIVAAAVILAILGATGTFSNSEPTPIESRQFSDKGKEGVKAAGFGGVGGKKDDGTTTSTTTTTTTTTDASLDSLLPSFDDGLPNNNDNTDNNDNLFSNEDDINYGNKSNYEFKE